MSSLPFSTLVGLDRHAARCVNFVLVVLRIAVHGARSAPRQRWQPAKDSAGISRAEARGSFLVETLICRWLNGGQR
jgi:hypothetical protein